MFPFLVLRFMHAIVQWLMSQFLGLVDIYVFHGFNANFFCIPFAIYDTNFFIVQIHAREEREIKPNFSYNKFLY